MSAVSSQSASDRLGLPVSPERLARLPVFQPLAEEEREKAASCLTLLPLKRGDYLYRAGEAYKDSVFILLSGRLRRSWESGDTETLAQGELLGLPNAMDASPYRGTSQAMTDAEVLVLPAKDLHQVEERCPALADAVNRVIAERIRDRGAARQPSSRVLSVPARAVMKSPLITCGPDVSLSQAFSIMHERRIGSLGVTDAGGKLLGVLTYAGLSQAVLDKGAKADDNVLRVACETPRCVGPEAPMWEVEEILQDPTLKYVIVVEEGSPLGMISQTDVLQNLIAHQGFVLAEVTKAENFKELASQQHRVVSVTAEAREHNRRASAALRIVSEFHLALQRRCAELTLEEMDKDGLGPAPAAFALIIMGSGARKEMLLNPDQDNGIILADGAVTGGKQARQWFQVFAERFNKHLDEVGYVLCPGEIMARNAAYHKTLTEWKQQFSHVVHSPTEKAARWANIVLDFDTLYGDDALTTELRKHVVSELREQSRLLTLMVRDDAEGRPPLGLFNRLITLPDDSEKGDKKGKGKGKLDIKRNGLRILADAARIYALRAGISTPNTLERLNSLVRQGVLSRESVDSVREAYEILVEMLLDHQISLAQEGKAPDKLIKLKRLSPMEQETLRISMRVIKNFQERLQADFDTVVF